MLTFLLTVAVVAAAIALAVLTAVGDPDQPATLRPRPRRERAPRRRPTPRRVVAPAAVTVAEPADVGGGFSDAWVPVSGGISGWVRLRSGFVLTVVLAVLGALVAFGVSGMLLLIALAVRNAVG